ncbi:hypothetical protein D3C86_1773320 [compost metagenome]
MLKIAVIHGQNQIETPEITGADLAPAQGGKIITAQLRRLPSAAVRRLAHMPIAGAGGIDLDALQPQLTQLVPQHRLGGRRAADIAQTDKQDPHQAPRSRRTRSRSSWVSTPAGGACRASATWMRTPCQSARSCSRHSVSSSQQGPQATKS